MKILLVKPPSKYVSKCGGWVDVPFGLLSLAAQVRKFADVTILDLDAENLSQEEVLKKIKDASPDVVGITCWISSFVYVQWLSKEIKSVLPKTFVVGGGPFATVAPELYLENTAMDVIVLGEGEITFSCLLRTMQKKDDSLYKVDGIAYRNKNAVAYTSKRKELFDLDKTPVLPCDYDLVPLKKYLSVPFGRFPHLKGTVILTDRGCPYQCSFCNSQYLGTSRTKHSENIREEVQFFSREHSVGLFYVGDAIVILNRQKTLALSQIMGEENAQWFGAARVDLILSQTDLLPIMAQGGCRELWLGFESINQSVLKKSCKGTTVEQNKKAIELIRNAGIQPMVFILFGLPSDTETSMRETINFAKSERLLTNPSSLFLIPQTPLWEYAKNIGKAPPSILEYAIDFGNQYYQSNRSKPLSNLSEVSDEKIEAAMEELLEHNKSLD